MSKTTNIKIGTVNLTVNVGANGKRLFTKEDRQELLDYMIKANLSEQDMAILLNCKPQTLKRWKTGKQKRYLSRQEKEIRANKTYYRKPKRQYAISYKIQVVEEYYRSNQSLRDIADRHDISQGTIGSWKKLYDEGKLCMDNTIAVSHTPNRVIRKRPNMFIRIIAKLFNLRY